jgi:DNA ligase-1
MSIKNFVQVLKACESAGGSGSKDVIKAALATCTPETRILFNYAMDPFLVFGVKKFDRLPQSQYSGTDNGDIKIITKVLDKLASRELTGNAARTAVSTMLAEFTWETAKYIERIIDKDLQAGFSADTYNLVLLAVGENDVTDVNIKRIKKLIDANGTQSFSNNPLYGSLVRVFNVMLADACKTDEDFEEIAYPCLADIKYDGERNIAIVTSDGVTHHSRSGKIAEHMAGLFDDELLEIRDKLGYDYVLDGERMARTYIDTINAKKKGPEGEAARKNMVFRAFFLMPLSDWFAQRTKITMAETREFIAELISALGLKKIILTDSVIVNDHGEMMKELDRVTTAGFQGMPNGQEGLILKVMNAPYKWDRTPTWCKVKKFFDADARIISWEFGKKRHANRMGRVNVAGWLEDGTYFEVGVGSGWSDGLRDDVAKNFDTKYKGKTLVVRYQEVSKGKNKEAASLRFPTVDREKLLRDDKIVPLKD